MILKNDQKEWINKVAKMKDDTLKVNYYHQIAESYTPHDSTNTFKYLKKSLELARKLHWNDGVAQSYFFMGERHLDFYNRSKGLSLFQLALSKTKKPKILANIYFSIGDLYLEESNYTKALSNYHQSLQLFESIKDKKGIIKVLISMGSLYTGFGKNTEALHTYNKALKVSQNEAKRCI